MSTFTNPCRVELVGKYRFKLLEPFEYHIGEYPAKDPEKIIRVPAGYITDFASIPRVFWSIVSPCDEYAKAAVIHDWLHVKGYFSREKTDDIFNEAMKVLKVPDWKRRIVYNAVKYCSGPAWRRNRMYYGSSKIGEK